MFCYACGKEIPIEAVFCNYCGTRVQGSSIISGTLPPLPGEGRGSAPVSFPGQQTAPIWSQPVQPMLEERVSQPPPAPSRLQRLLVRMFQRSLAENAIFGILLGSVIAVVAGVLVSWLFLAVAHAIAPRSVQSPYVGDSIGFVLGIIPLRVPFKDALQLFLVMHGVGQSLSGSNQVYTYIAPLNGLLVFPGLLLTLGGYISASTDFQNRAQQSLLRGVAIAVPYTLLLVIIATQVNGSTLPPGEAIGSLSTVNMDGVTLIVFGLLWGMLFGLLGGSLKLAHGQWRHMVRKYLQASPYTRLKGMSAGALSAAGSGFSLALLWLCSLTFYTTYFERFLGNNLCYTPEWQTRTLWTVAQGPLYAVNLFFFSFGASITIHSQSQYVSVSCFYSIGTQSALTLRDGGWPWWIYTLLLIPAISLFLGGRISVALANVKDAGPRMVQGAGIALPFTVFMIAFTLISSISATYVSPGNPGVAGSTLQGSAGVSITDLLLWALLSGAVLGALGGAYQGSRLQRGVSNLLAVLGNAAVFFALPVYFVLDLLCALPRSVPRSRARSLLYGSLLVALLLAIAAGVVGWSLITFNQTWTFDTNQRIKNILSVLLIALPGLLLLCACVSALGNDPVVEG